MAESAQVTQLGSEILLESATGVSVSQLGAEIALNPTPGLAVSQLGAEFLVTALVYPPIGGSARLLLGAGA